MYFLKMFPYEHAVVIPSKEDLIENKMVYVISKITVFKAAFKVCQLNPENEYLLVSLQVICCPIEDFLI